MNVKGIISAVCIIVLMQAVTSGCTSAVPEQPQAATPTPVIPAVDLHMKGYVEHINGNFSTALALYNQAIGADPNYVRAWTDKGNVLLRLNRTEEAVSAFDSALALENNLSVVWNSRGEALIMLGNYTGALDSFDNALKYDPGYGKARENRNLVLGKNQTVKTPGL